MTVQIPFEKNNWIFHTGPWFLPFCALVDVSKNLDILTLEFSITLMHLPFWTWVISGYCISCLSWTSFKPWKMSITFAAVIWDANHPCSVNTCVRTRILFYKSPRSTTLPLYFWYWGSSSEFFLRWQRSINDAKWTCPSLVPCFMDHFFLVSDFRQLPCLDFLQFFPFLLPLLPLHPEFSLLEASEWTCEQDCSESLEFIPFAVMWSWWGLCPAPF